MWWDDYTKVWAPFTEVLLDGSRLEIIGTVRATAVPSGLSGTLKGSFHFSPATLNDGPFGWASSCESDTHRFALTR